jgi:hypothetical protein
VSREHARRFRRAAARDGRRAIALGLELSVATGGTFDPDPGAGDRRAMPPRSVREHLAWIGDRLLRIVIAGRADPPDAALDPARREVRSAYRRLRGFRETGYDGTRGVLGPGDRRRIDDAFRHLATTLAPAFGYSRRERVALRVAWLGESRAEAAERIREQDAEIAAGRDPVWYESLTSPRARGCSTPRR